MKTFKNTSRILSLWLFLCFLMTETVFATGDQPDSVDIAFLERFQNAKDNDTLLIDALYDYAEYLDENGEPTRSIEQFEKAMLIARNCNDHRRLADVGNYYASVSWSLGDCQKSNLLYLEALEHAKETGDVAIIAKISMNLACNYNLMGNYQEAIDYALQALKIKEASGHLADICYHYINLSNIFRENGNIPKWEEYLNKAYMMKDVEGCANYVDISKIYNSLGSLTHERKEYQKALAYFDTVMQVSRAHNFDQGISTGLSNKASVYKDLGDIDKALELTLESEQYFGNHTYEIIYNNNWKALLYKEKGDYNEALGLVQENFDRDDIQGYSTEKIKTLELLYQLNFLLGNYDQAYIWNDSLRNNESRLRDERVREAVENLEIEYATEQKESRIELLTAENQIKTQRMRMGSGILVILLLTVGMVLYMLKLRHKQALLVQNNLQQKLLRSQMNPHFLFNALSSIQSFMYQNETKKAAGYLGNFASLTRGVLEYSTRDFISLCDELRILENYLELEVMRMGGKISYQTEVDENLDCEFIMVPPLVIQPFVENCVKHAFSGIDYPGLIVVSIRKLENRVEVMVEDNGIGLENAVGNSAEEHKSMSMSIFKERQAVLEKKLGEPVTFELLDMNSLTSGKSSGSKVVITLPVITMDTMHNLN